MANLIDKDALVAEIKARISDIKVSQKAGLIKKRDANKKIIIFKSILSLIDTLEVKKVDFDVHMFTKGMSTVFNLPSSETKNTEENPLNWEYAIAKHFFELGLQAQRKSVSIQNIDDVLEEFGVDPYSREAKMLKESYYAALDKLLEEKGE